MARSHKICWVNQLKLDLNICYWKRNDRREIGSIPVNIFFYNSQPLSYELSLVNQSKLDIAICYWKLADKGKGKFYFLGIFLYSYPYPVIKEKPCGATLSLNVTIVKSGWVGRFWALLQDPGVKMSPHNTSAASHHCCTTPGGVPSAFKLKDMLLYPASEIIIHVQINTTVYKGTCVNT